jgi:hypothetical protein
MTPFDRIRSCRVSSLAATLSLATAWADATTPAAPAATSGPIQISVENEYAASLNFGALGTGSRNGTDRVTGVLDREGDTYVGVVDADVVSTQGTTGLTGRCGPSTYGDTQKLRVTGHVVDGFNTQFQRVTFNAGSPSSEYLLLEFVPETAPADQPANRDPYQDTVVNCHTLIETEATIDDPATGTSSMLFLPLNDTRWTMKGGGYIIALPSSGILEYTDAQVLGTTTLGPFQVQKSIWTIKVERLPAGWEPPPAPGGQQPSGPGGCPGDPNQSGSSPKPSQGPCKQTPSNPPTPTNPPTPK